MILTHNGFWRHKNKERERRESERIHCCARITCARARASSPTVIIIIARSSVLLLRGAREKHLRGEVFFPGTK